MRTVFQSKNKRWCRNKKWHVKKNGMFVYGFDLLWLEQLSCFSQIISWAAKSSMRREFTFMLINIVKAKLMLIPGIYFLCINMNLSSEVAIIFLWPYPLFLVSFLQEIAFYVNPFTLRTAVLHRLFFPNAFCWSASGVCPALVCFCCPFHFVPKVFVYCHAPLCSVLFNSSHFFMTLKEILGNNS